MKSIITKWDPETNKCHYPKSDQRLQAKANHKTQRGHFNPAKGPVNPEAITIPNIHAPNYGAPNHWNYRNRLNK